MPNRTGSAITATRAATPCSTMRRGSECCWSVSIVIRSRSFGAATYGLDVVPVRPGPRTKLPGPILVTKKSGSRGNPLSKTDRITSDRYEISKSWTVEI